MCVSIQLHREFLDVILNWGGSDGPCRR